MRLAARYAARSDIGRHRQTNEDAWLARPPLFAVADGMGGAQAGEVASRVALETVAAHAADIDPLDRAGAGELLLAACQEANRRVWQLSREYAAQAGMGTTLTALALCTDGARLAHIGDSRAYLLHDGALTQVSDDHSLVGEMVRSGELPAEETATHPLRSILSRALGTEPEPQIDLLNVDLTPGDVLLLCSDGLTGPVPDSRIALLLAEPDPAEAARRLVEAALREGGPDNITVVVVRVDEAPRKAPGEEAEGASVEVVAVAELPDDTAGGAAASEAGLRSSPWPRQAARDAVGDVPPAIDDADETVGVLESGSAVGAKVSPPAGEAPPTVTDEPSPSPADRAAGAGDASSPAAVAVRAQDARDASPLEPDRPHLGAAAATVERPYLGGAAAPAAAAGVTGKHRRRSWVTGLVALAVIVAVLAAGLVAASQLEWVGVSDDGVVTVNRGLPWDFVGVRLYRERERTAVLYADLSAAQQQRVDAHDIGWAGSGSRLVAELGGASP